MQRPQWDARLWQNAVDLIKPLDRVGGRHGRAGRADDSIAVVVDRVSPELLIGRGASDSGLAAEEALLLLDVDGLLCGCSSDGGRVLLEERHGDWLAWLLTGDCWVDGGKRRKVAKATRVRIHN